MDIKEVEVVKEVSFDAAHYLPGYLGPCANIHGHHYVLQVGVQNVVDASGTVLDFSYLKAIIQEKVVDLLDHTCLNEVEGVGFPTNPTAENMVGWIRIRLSESGGLGKHLSFIRLHETPTSYAEWRRD